MEYNTKDRAGEFFTCPGNQFETLYDPVVQKDGTIELVESGKKDLVQEINSWKEHTDMAYILRQMTAGMYPERTGAMYGDFTKAPENMAQAMQIMIDAERAFYELPLDVRNKFDNNYQKWMVMANTNYDEFGKLMGFVSEDVKEAIEPVVDEKGVEE